MESDMPTGSPGWYISDSSIQPAVMLRCSFATMQFLRDEFEDDAFSFEGKEVEEARESGAPRIQDCMLTVNCHESSFAVRFVEKKGIFACEQFRAYMKAHIPKQLFRDNHGRVRPIDELEAEQLVKFQALFWSVFPKSQAALTPKVHTVAENEAHTAKLVAWISVILTKAPLVFVVRDRTPTDSCNNDLCSQPTAQVVSLEPILDIATLTPVSDHRLNLGKLFVFRRDNTKYTRMDFDINQLIPKRKPTFCTECLQCLWDRRVRAWGVMANLACEKSYRSSTQAAPSPMAPGDQAQAANGQNDLISQPGSFSDVPATMTGVPDDKSTHEESQPECPLETDGVEEVMQARKERPDMGQIGVPRVEILASAHRACSGAISNPSSQTSKSPTPSPTKLSIALKLPDNSTNIDDDDLILNRILKTPPVQPTAHLPQVKRQTAKVGIIKPPISASAVSHSLTESPLSLTVALPPIYCSCRKPEDGSKMVQCTNSNCPVEWYHYDCLNKPQKLSSRFSNWICEACTISLESERQPLSFLAYRALSDFKAPFLDKEILDALACPGPNGGIVDPYGLAAQAASGTVLPVALTAPGEEVSDLIREQDSKMMEG